MSAKIEFFYTHNHSYTATNVIEDSILHDDEVIQYVNRSVKEGLDIQSINTVEVKKHDLKFAVVTYSADSHHVGNTSIIHGLAGKFDVYATYDEAEKIRKSEAADLEAQDRINYKRQREAEKFVERRHRRSEERKDARNLIGNNQPK